MPLYEYACRQCGRQFEYLTRADRSPACPGCSSTDLEKQLSVFAVSAGSQGDRTLAAPRAPCGACGDPRGPGACSVN